MAMGRPTVFSDELANKIIKRVGQGHYTTTICNEVGIARTTLWQWLQDGAEPDATPRLAKFVTDYRRAEARAEMRILHQIKAIARGGKGDWKALAWVAERRWPAKWAGRSDANREQDEPPSKKKQADPGKSLETAKEARRLRAVNGGK